MTEHTTYPKAKLWNGPTPYDAKIEAIRPTGIPPIYLQGKAEGYRAAMNSEVVVTLYDTLHAIAHFQLHPSDTAQLGLAGVQELAKQAIAPYAVGLKGEA